MNEIGNFSDVSEMSKHNVEGFKEIKPESSITVNDAKSHWDKEFKSFDKKTEIDNNDLKEALKEYVNDLKNNSDFKETLDNISLDISDLRDVSPDENAKMREEFNNNKEELIQQWEIKNGQQWPVYKEDVYITNKHGERVKIREAGDRYDAHHIQPLCIGGQNKADNITPLNAEVHFDHKGVHRTDGAYDKLCKAVGG